MPNMYIPAVDDVPARLPRAAQLAAIRSHAKASEAVVNLLCALAYGDRDDGWHPNTFGGKDGGPLLHQYCMLEAA